MCIGSCVFIDYVKFDYKGWEIEVISFEYKGLFVCM